MNPAEHSQLARRASIGTSGAFGKRELRYLENLFDSLKIRYLRAILLYQQRRLANFGARAYGAKTDDRCMQGAYCIGGRTARHGHLQQLAGVRADAWELSELQLLHDKLGQSAQCDFLVSNQKIDIEYR